MEYLEHMLEFVLEEGDVTCDDGSHIDEFEMVAFIRFFAILFEQVS
jgi:hypothetical protein